MNSSRWALVFIVFMTALVRAQIPVTKEPHHHVVFENAQFRIEKDMMKLRVEDADDKERDYLVVSMTPNTSSDASSIESRR